MAQTYFLVLGRLHKRPRLVFNEKSRAQTFGLFHLIAVQCGREVCAFFVRKANIARDGIPLVPEQTCGGRDQRNDRHDAHNRESPRAVPVYSALTVRCAQRHFSADTGAANKKQGSDGRGLPWEGALDDGIVVPEYSCVGRKCRE